MAAVRPVVARRLTLYVILFSSFITLGTTSLQLYQDYRDDLAQIDRQLQQIENIHLPILNDTLWTADAEKLQIHLEGIAQMRGIQFLEVADAQDPSKIWARTGEPPPGDVRRREYPMSHRHRGRDIAIGTLRVMASLDEVYQRLLERVWSILVSNAFKTFLVAIFILFLFHRLVTRHLLHIAGFTNALDLDQLDQRLQLARKDRSEKGPDELDHLVDGINHMLANMRQSLASLEQFNRRFETLARVAPVGIYRTDARGHCLYVNQRWCEFTGLSAEQASGDGWIHALHPEDRERVLQQWQQAIDTGTPFRSEYRFRRADGHETWVLGVADPEYDERGRIGGFVGSVVDITERKRIENMMHNIAAGISAETNERFFQHLVGYLARTLEVDYAFVGRLDMERNQVHTVALCAHGEIRDNISYDLAHTPCNELMRKHLCIYPCDIRQRFPRDRLLAEFGVESYLGLSLLDGQGKPLGILVVMHEHPLEHTAQLREVLEIFAARAGAELERLLAEAALKESRERMIHAQRLAQFGNWEMDLVNHRLSGSDEVYRIFGADPATTEDPLELFRKIVHPEDYPRVDQTFRTAIRHHKLYQAEYRLRLPGGRIKHVLARGEIFYAADDTPLRAVGTVQDITERVAMEQALRRSQKMEAIGQLSGGIAHDFNNQLGIIIGYLDFLKNHLEGQQKPSRWVETATRATQRCMDLTRQLLSFSRRQGRSEASLNLNDCIDEIKNVIARSVTPEVEVKYFLANPLWTTRADPGELQDAIINLAINARDAMPNGGTLVIETGNIHLDRHYAERNPGVTPGDYVQLNISDTGTGMDAQTLERACEPFFTTKDEGKGTGLGLAMVYGFAKRCGGFVKLYSEPNAGTSVRLYLPRCQDCEVVHAALDDTAREPLPRGNETVLLVDDEPDLLQLAARYLSELGYQVYTAENARQALALLDDPSLPIDILFSDVVMPGGINGYELAQKAVERRPAIKVLLTSGFTSRTLAHNGLARFNANLLPKPYRKDQLAQRIRRVLDQDRET